MSDEGNGILYEQQARSFVAFDVESVTLEEGHWIYVKALPYLGVERTLSLNFKAARALAYKLLAIADENEKGE